MKTKTIKVGDMKLGQTVYVPLTYKRNDGSSRLPFKMTDDKDTFSTWCDDYEELEVLDLPEASEQIPDIIRKTVEDYRLRGITSLKRLIKEVDPKTNEDLLAFVHAWEEWEKPDTLYMVTWDEAPKGFLKVDSSDYSQRILPELSKNLYSTSATKFTDRETAEAYAKVIGGEVEVFIDPREEMQW